MYQALRNVGTDTQLIIYPNENHSISRPSFQRDRMQRYLDWYAKYLKPPGASDTSGAAQRD
jgi:dipeptidyl aminopeptidase/acylaminoacyl peptidase